MLFVMVGMRLDNSLKVKNEWHKSFAKQIILALVQGKKLDYRCWAEVDPVYGSAAYVEYNG